MKTIENSFSMVLKEELQDLRDTNLYRAIRSLECVSSVEGHINGKPITLFCGNDYLGMATHERVKKAFLDAANSHGVGAGAARLISGDSHWHRKLEERLAIFKSKERALLFSSGYLANLGILSAFAGKEDVIILDKLCHASIIDAARLSGATIRVYPHKNYTRCEELLCKAQKFRRRFLISESLFSMEGDFANLQKLSELKETYESILIIDDAHGTGVLGCDGRGVANDLSSSVAIDILMGTLSKALGTLGGFVAGSSEIIEILINKARPFIYDTALPPAICAAALEALNVLEEEPEHRERLKDNLEFLRQGLKEKGIHVQEQDTPIVPIVLEDETKALELSEALLREGFLVPAIRPPTVPKGTSRLRVTISALHTQAQMGRFIEALAKHKRI